MFLHSSVFEQDHPNLHLLSATEYKRDYQNIKPKIFTYPNLEILYIQIQIGHGKGYEIYFNMINQSNKKNCNVQRKFRKKCLEIH